MSIVAALLAWAIAASLVYVAAVYVPLGVWVALALVMALAALGNTGKRS